MTDHYSWKRLFWYYTGWYDDYPTDIPEEKDVLRKQVLMKQVGLSKLKMKKVIIQPSVPFDLQKIDNKVNSLPIELKPPKLKRESKEDYDIPKPPPSSPINMSQKQKQHKVSYNDKLKLLKNL
jgi:hypothetical protein